MKPTQSQKEVIQIVSDIISSWENSNDLKSPTVRSDIKEEITKLDCFVSEEDKQKLYDEIRHILATILYRIKD